MSESKEIINFFNSLRWRDRGDYKFNKWILNISNIILLLWIPLIIFTNPGILTEYKTPQFYCPDNYIRCENPLYNTCNEWYCNIEYLPSGYDTRIKHNTIYHITPLIWFLCLVSPYIINHLLYNRGKRFLI